jgi:hypothetical protein
MEVISLERDFSDGVKLINLIEILSGSPPMATKTSVGVV